MVVVRVPISAHAVIAGWARAALDWLNGLLQYLWLPGLSPAAGPVPAARGVRGTSQWAHFRTVPALLAFAARCEGALLVVVVRVPTSAHAVVAGRGRAAPDWLNGLLQYLWLQGLPPTAGSIPAGGCFEDTRCRAHIRTVPTQLAVAAH